MKDCYCELCKLTHTYMHNIYLVVHLFRAVEDVHHYPQGPPQVLGGLCLACASGTGRGSTHGEVQGLGQGDVAPGKRAKEKDGRDFNNAYV